MTENKEKVVYWTTKGGRKIPIDKMEDKHLLNSLRMCMNNEIEYNDFLNCSTNPILAPRGDMACMAFEQEMDSYFDRYMNSVRWIKILTAEVERRGLKPLSTIKPMIMPKIKSVQNLEFGTLYELDHSEPTTNHSFEEKL